MYSSIQVFKYSSIQVFKYSRIQNDIIIIITNNVKARDPVGSKKWVWFYNKRGVLVLNDENGSKPILAVQAGSERSI